MLVGKTPREVIDMLPLVLKKPRRTHKTSFAEILRLFEMHGYTLGRRLKGFPRGLALLRIQRRGKRCWHWSITDGKLVYDPAWMSPGLLSYYIDDTVTYYEIEKL